VDAARLHTREVAVAGISTDQVIFMSWNPCPAHAVLAADPTVLGSLIPDYFEHRH
jgi:hypothetical protein